MRRRDHWVDGILFVLVLLLAAAPAAADIAGASFSTIPTPAGTSLSRITVGADLNVWGVEIGNVRQIVRGILGGGFTGFPLVGFGDLPVAYEITAGAFSNANDPRSFWGGDGSISFAEQEAGRR